MDAHRHRDYGMKYRIGGKTYEIFHTSSEKRSGPLHGKHIWWLEVDGKEIFCCLCYPTTLRKLFDILEDEDD